MPPMAILWSQDLLLWAAAGLVQLVALRLSSPTTTQREINSQVGNAMTRAFSFLLLASSYLGVHTYILYMPRNKEGSLRKGGVAIQFAGKHSGTGKDGQFGPKGGSTRLWTGQDLGCCWRALEAWEPSTPLCAFVYSFFSLKGRGRDCGRTMNEICFNSRML
ncbi:hypothetical protein HJG60_012211 [Phyllostomus discolor]|uniref:Uncharacterized protein n=1 Tax=Phyllostomus discolor TaxID=89673 RepID=A0A834DSS0_9CHIR|nr:hypothetical protein HJG60_012211 [Phyllostomus discolor]